MLCTIKASERPRSSSSSNSITHIFNHAPPAPHGEGKKKEGVWRGMMVRLYILLLPSYTKREREREEKRKISGEPPLSHAERCRGMPEVQRRLAGMKSFASGANRRLLFISSAYRFSVVIFGDAEGHLKEFLMGLWCEKQGDLLCWCSLLILNEHISSLSLSLSLFPPERQYSWTFSTFSSSCRLERTLKHSGLESASIRA